MIIKKVKVVVVRVLVQLVLVSDLLASVFSSPGGYGTRYPDRYTLLPWFLNFVFVHINLLYTVVGNRLLVNKTQPGLFT